VGSTARRAGSKLLARRGAAELLLLRLALAGLVLAAATGCFGADPGLTESGLAKPVVSFEWPVELPAGTTEELIVEVENPGPGDMSAFSIAFAAIAIGGAEGNAEALLLPAAPPEELGDDQPLSSSIAAIEPEPLTVGQGGLVFGFGPLPAGESTSVSFDIEVPEEPGSYANSVQAYDSQALDRIDAQKLQVEVTN
jgi:hypothetical protein